MNKLLKRITAIMLTIALVCMVGCKKTDDPDNGGNNGNNGGNGGEAPEAPAIVSTTEVQYDGTVYIEAVFEDGSKLYFSIISPTEVSVVSGEFYYHNSPSIAYLYRGDVIIPENIVHIGKSYSVVAISDKAFYGDDLVTSVYIPNSVISIKTYSEWIDSFYGYIYYGAFQGCSNLNSVRMSENIQEIGTNAFAGCPFYKESVTIPKQVKRIGAKAFDSEIVYFNADSCMVAGGCLRSFHGGYFSAFPNMNTINYGDNVKVLPAYIFNNWRKVQVDIPLSVTMVQDKAFYECIYLERVNGFDHVRYVGNSVFCGCNALTSIELNESLEIISDSLFYFCVSLSNVEIPNSVITIEQDAFHGYNSLTEISLPSSISQIKDRAFCVVWVDNIETSITCMAINPPVLGDVVFGSRIIQLIRVPLASVEAYKTADGWKDYADVIVGI